MFPFNFFFKSELEKFLKLHVGISLNTFFSFKTPKQIFVKYPYEIIFLKFRSELQNPSKKFFLKTS